MQITPLGKVVLFLIAVGIAVGGYRVYQKGNISLPKLPTLKHTSDNSANNGNNQGSNTGTQTTDAGDSGTQNPNEIELVSSASKKGWLVGQIDAYNAQGGAIKIKPRFMETREAMHAILDGKVKPGLYSPSSVIWADRLSEAWKGNNPILDTSDSNSYRVLMRTPMVFLTTKEKANFLRPLLGSQDCWSNIRALSNGGKSVPWGRFKWAHADPLNANSGMLTLAMILNDYAERTNQSGAIEAVANSAGFTTYLKSLESRLIYNAAVEKGSSALVSSFTDDPSRYDFITAYEAAAMDAVKNDNSLAVIYPNPTVNAENAVAALDGPWLSDDQKNAAREFLKFLARPESAREGLKEYFRPLRGASLDTQIAQYSANGFKQSYSALELPPYAALNAAAFKWRTEIAQK